MPEKITRLPGAKGQESEAAPEKDWDWTCEVQDACLVLELLQQVLMESGFQGSDLGTVNPHAVARIIGMTRGRLRDMADGMPFVPIPGELC
jgi:hypothetical protein